MLGSGGGSWHYSSMLTGDETALAWGITTKEWDGLDAEHQGRMIEVLWTQRTRQAWEAFVSRRK